jgi:hypothetical protein
VAVAVVKVAVAMVKVAVVKVAVVEWQWLQWQWQWMGVAEGEKNGEDRSSIDGIMSTFGIWWQWQWQWWQWQGGSLAIGVSGCQYDCVGCI